MAHPKALSITGGMIITGKVNFGAVSPASFSASLDASSYSLIKNEAVDITPLVVNGGEGTRVYSISRSLPSGLSFNTSTGHITGTPTGVFTNASFTISVVDDLPNSGSQTFTIGVILKPLQISYNGVGSVVQGASVSMTPVSGYDGVGSFTYSISPSLPSGLSLNTSNGLISGTPSTSGSSVTYTITVRDSANQTASQTVSFAVASPPPPPPPPPTYSMYITTQNGSGATIDYVNPGDSLTFAVSTTNFGNGTLYWSIDSTQSAYFQTTSGSIAITSNSGSFTITAKPSFQYHTGDTATVHLRVNSTSGYSWATESVTINAQTVQVLGTIDSSTSNPFTFTVKKADNPDLVDAFTHNGWTLYFTDARFSDGTFNAAQTNLLAQAPSGFTSITSEDSNNWYISGWFGIQQSVPQGTEITVEYTNYAIVTPGATPSNAIGNNVNYSGAYNLITGQARPTTTRSFTVEGWVKWDTSASRCVGTILGSPSDTARQPHYLGIYVDDNYWNGSQTVNGSNIRVDGYYVGQNVYVPTSSFAKNTWYHIAVSRNASQGNVEAVWVNGVRCGGTQTDNIVYESNSLTLANGWPNPQNGLPFIGYQSDVRIVSNAYVYDPTSSTITVPTAPLSAISNCIALIQSNATGALATDNSSVGQSLTFVSMSHSSDSPYTGGSGAGGSWYNASGNGAVVMDPGVYNC